LTGIFTFWKQYLQTKSYNAAIDATTSPQH